MLRELRSQDGEEHAVLGIVPVRAVFVNPLSVGDGVCCISKRRFDGIRYTVHRVV